MSAALTSELIDDLRRAALRWKILAIVALAAVGLTIVLGSGVAWGLVRQAEEHAEAARKAEMETRQQADQAALRAVRLTDEQDSRAARLLAEGLAVLNPSLRTLLKESAKNDPDHKSRFFTTLSTLAQKHGSSFEEYVEQRPLHEVDEGYAVYIPEGGKRYIVAILRGDDNFIPGRDTQCLLLLDEEGRLLDKLSCDISNRLTRMFVDYSGIFRTEVPDAAADGARLVIRYIPEDGSSVSGNWSHGITHAGRTHHFVWNQHFPGSISSAELDGKGLCRIAIRNDTLTVLFPKMEGAAAVR
jgi:hypothetical protein